MGSEPSLPLIVVTGAPGTGKTTLARALAKELGLALVAKDVIKEALANVLGAPDIQAAQQLGRATIRVMYALARDMRGGILEANFDERAVPELGPLHPVEIFCRCDPALVIERYSSRDRHPVHFDEELLEDMRARLQAGQKPVGFGGPLLEVDTTTEVDTAEIVAWLRSLGPTTT